MDFGFEDYEMPDYFYEDMLPEGMDLGGMDLSDLDLSNMDLSNIPEELLEQLMAEYFQDQYEMYDYDQPAEDVEFSYLEHFRECGLPTLQQGVQIISSLLLLSISLKLFSVLSVPKVLVHLLSFSMGVACLYLFFETSLHYLITFSILGYSLLLLLGQSGYHRKGAACAVMCLLYLVTLFQQDQVPFFQDDQEPFLA
ncbi:hypothetical protein HOLleu_05363 [Holothuria leucospilota]|uniref:Uncharacterized protein n=1 Tax=Holothuria leucospilota TaxID=206669 RepID=A0A9Q1HIW6_HOLLE|nr:hypothetical protein HOLleu_05363 [Holothuria leucospilota]